MARQRTNLKSLTTATALASFSVAIGALGVACEKNEPAPAAPVPTATAPTPEPPPPPIPPEVIAAARAALAGDAGGAAAAGPFSTEHASLALGKAEEELHRCIGEGNPQKEGHVNVTFFTEGIVGSAVIDQGTFTDDEKACVVNAFRAAVVPPFQGENVVIGKAFKTR